MREGPLDALDDLEQRRKGKKAATSKPTAKTQKDAGGLDLDGVWD